MYRIGAALSGYGLLTLFSWLPLWQMGQMAGARTFFGYFLTICVLVFGVFMVSGDKQDFRIIPFALGLVAGGLVSFGIGMDMFYFVPVGIVSAYGVFVLFAPR